MANERVGISLQFTADTKQAKAELESLQSALTKVINSASQDSANGLTKEIQQSAVAAAQLKVQLQNATNVKTGKLDLSKFNESLQRSGMTIKDYQKYLYNMGPAGEQAFSQLSHSIMQAEVPLKRTNHLVEEFKVSLKNVAKYQISTAIFRGFTGAISQAYNYAQDLNESLNKIRIVTGQNTEQMAKFAVQANKAAQALSTTTTRYTDAALIYYQQGLSDSEVRDRTETTIKMSQATGDSATEVSSYMTAIWNNFDDGSKSLEHYSDVITALGAKTAASSSEIAQGLSQFAPIADTVGLSYEYATAALATLVSTTRQSADLIGNSLKTIFSRLEGLKLGESLEDGTDLNKYSAALEAVGVHIKDQNGQLKNMDTILDELGERWQTLSKDQQMALAQTVAGTRQYNQLISLMANWDKMQENVQFGRQSEGTLTKQAEIYQESWEAASTRVRAALEEIYQDLIKDDFFIDLMDGFTGLINLADKFIDSIGGLPGVLSLVSSMMLKAFGPEIGKGINNTIANIKNSTTQGKMALEGLREATLKATLDQIDENSVGGSVNKQALESQAKIQQAMLDSSGHMSEIEKGIAQAMLEQNQALYDQLKAKQQLAEKAQTQQTNIEAQMDSMFGEGKYGKERGMIRDAGIELERAKADGDQKEIQAAMTKLKEAKQAFKDAYTTDQMKESNQQVEQAEQRREQAIKELEDAQRILQQATDDYNKAQELYNEKDKNLIEAQKKVDDAKEKLQKNNEKITTAEQKIEKARQDLSLKQQSRDATREGTAARSKADIAVQRAEEKLRDLENELQTLRKENSNLKGNLTKATKKVQSMAGEKGAAAREIKKKEVPDQLSNDVQTKTEGVTQATEDLTEAQDKQTKKQEEVNKNLKNGAQALNAEGQAAGVAAQATAEAGQAAKDASLSTEDILKRIKEFKGETITFGDSLVSFTNGLTNLSTAAMSIKGIVDIWSNDDLSLWEKGLMTMSSLSMVAGSLSAAMENLNAEKLKGFLLDKDNQLQIFSNILGRTLEAEATDEVAKKKRELYIAGLAESLAGKSWITQKLVEIGILKAETVALHGTTAAVWEFTAALAANPITWIVGGVVALTAAIVYLNSITAESKFAKEMEKAKEATETAKIAADEAQQAYQHLLDTINAYDSAAEKLKTLSNNTTEFREALSDANEKALELIKTFGITQVGVDEKGLILLDKDEIASSKERFFNASQSAKAIYQSASLREDRLELDRNRARVDSTLSNDDTWNKMIAGLRESIMGGNLENLQEQLNSGSQEAFDLVQANLIKSFTGINQSWNEIDDILKQNILSYIWAFQHSADAFRGLEQQSDALAAQEKAIRTVNSANLLSNNEKYTNSDHKQAMANALANRTFTSAEIKVQAETYGPQVSIQDLKKAYVKAMGGEASGFRFDTSTYEVQQLNSEGVWQKIENQTETFLENAIIAAAENALRQASSEDVIDEINSIYSQSNKAGDNKDAVEKYIDAIASGDLNKIDKESAEKLKELINDDEIFNDEFKERLKAVFDVDDDFFEKLNQQIENWRPPKFNLDSWKQQLQSVQDAINKLKFGEVIDEAVANQLKTILGDDFDKYFLDMGDGTYKLIALAEKLKTTIDSIEIGKLGKQIKSEEGLISGFENSFNDKFINDGINEWYDSGKTSTEIAEFYGENTKENYIQVVKENFSEASEINTEDLNEAFTQAIDIVQSHRQALEQNKDTMALMATSTADLEKKQSEFNLTNKDVGKGLVNLASQYEDCADDIADYNKEILEAGKDANKAQTAQNKLWRAIRNQEWGKLTKNIKDYAKVLTSNTSSIEEQKDAYKSIAKEFNKVFDTKIPEEFNEEYVKMFKDWANAPEEMKNDIAETILDFANLDKAAQEVGENEILIPIETDSGEEKLEHLSEHIDKIKSIIESNPIKVDAYGNADMTNLIQGLLNAGYEADAVAQILRAIGQTHVDVSGYGDMMDQVFSYNLTTPDGIQAFGQYLTGVAGYVQTSGQVPSGFKATGGSGSSNMTNLGGSKGGGGGGGKQAKHAEKKSDKGKERYHTVQNQLEDLNAEYDDISKAKDRAFGEDRIDAIDDEIKKTDELIKKQEEYLDEIEKYEAIDIAQMNVSLDELFDGQQPTIEFDARGNISNFDEIQDAMYELYNNNSQKYTEDSEAWKIFEKRYEYAEDMIKQYEETYDLMRDQEEEYQELLTQRADAMLEKAKLEIELKMDISKDSLSLLDYELDKLDDKAFAAAEALTLLSQKADNLYSQMKTDREGLNKVLGQSLSSAEIKMFYDGDFSVLQNKEFTDEQMNTIKEYRDNLLDLNKDLLEVRKTVEEKLKEAFEEFNEELDKGTTTIEHFESILESYQNIIDIVGKNGLGLDDKAIKALNNAINKNNIDQIKASKKQYEAIESVRKDLENKLNQAIQRNNEDEIQYWKSQLDEMTTAAQEAQEKLMSDWEDALDSLNSQFEKAVEVAVEKFNQSIYGLRGLAGLAEDFDREREMAENYLDDYEKIYEFSKLNRDINNSIDDTKNIAGKQKLLALQDKINKLDEDGVEISKYDLEYLQKEYDLRMAEIALEDARNSKDTVRLTKDNEGNWSYAYTQNTDAVKDAQQKYEDALYAMQDLSSKYINEVSEELINTSQEMQEALAAVRVEDYASIDEYYNRLLQIQNSYQDQLDKQQMELQKALDNNKELYQGDWEAYHNATNYKISDMKDFAMAYNDILLGGLLNADNPEADFTTGITSATDELISNLGQSAEDYYNNVDEINKEAGSSLSGFSDDLNKAIESISESSEKAAEDVSNMADSMENSLLGLSDTINIWESDYGNAISSVIDENENLIESFNNLNQALSLPDGISVDYKLTNTSVTPERFSSGGYTGEWGPEGRMAILDQKELVLNAEDTSNILNIVDLTNQILKTLDGNAYAASLGFGNLLSAVPKDNNQVLEQNVHMEVVLPGVTDRNEVEIAIQNLMNTASQYANRK